MTFFLPRVVVRACTNALQKENKNKNNNNSDDRWFFCVRLKSHAYVRDVSRSSNLSVFFLRARERVGKKKKKRVKNLTFLKKFNKDEEEEKREKSSLSVLFNKSTHAEKSRESAYAENSSLKDDVFSRGRGAITACDATTTTTTTTTRRNTETNSRGDFPASFSEK